MLPGRTKRTKKKVIGKQITASLPNKSPPEKNVGENKQNEFISNANNCRDTIDCNDGSFFVSNQFLISVATTANRCM